MARRITRLLAALMLPLGVIAAATVQAAQSAAASVAWLNPNPSIGVNNNGQQWVFWKAADGDLGESYYNGTSWHAPQEWPQLGALGSTPSVTVLNPPASTRTSLGYQPVHN